MNTPNVVVILTDQQSRLMMSCAGNSFLKTPAIDGLAAEGTRFTRAYCTNPVCVPSRFSLFTGRMPSEIGLYKNGGATATPELIREIAGSGLGWTLKKAGYEAVYGGKQHFPKMTAEDLGFDVLGMDERDVLARELADYVRRPHDKPYCLVASFINPHDICYMAIRDHAEGEQQQRIVRNADIEFQELDDALALAKTIPDEVFWSELCPPLPANHTPQKEEPEAVSGLLDQRRFRLHARTAWDERTWRLHRWAYCRLTERVDSQIGIVLDALRASPDWDNTVVIFTSDHGDHDASHGLEHKTVPYEEAAGVPLVIRQPGCPGGRVDDRRPVSNGLDLYPTVCDYVGIDVPPHVEGLSLRPLAEGREWEVERSTVPLECEIGQGLVGGRFKYLKCFDGKNAEQLYDLQNDPGETRNCATDQGTQSALHEFREIYARRFDDR